MKRKYIAAAFGLLLCLFLCLRSAFWYVDALSIPDCLEASDHLLDVTVAAVKKGQQDSLLMDAVVTRVIEAKCNVLVDRKLRLSCITTIRILWRVKTSASWSDYVHLGV